MEVELPGAVGSASYRESHGKPGNFGQVFATGNSQPPAESLRGEEGMGSVSAEVPRPETAGSLSMTIIIQKLHSQDR